MRESQFQNSLREPMLEGLLHGNCFTDIVELN